MTNLNGIKLIFLLSAFIVFSFGQNNFIAASDNIEFFPSTDTVFYYGGCCTPNLNVNFKNNNSSQPDSILFSTDTNFELLYSDSIYVFNETNICGFEISVSLKSNNYELWYQPIKTWWDTIEYKIPSDTTLYLFGYFNLKLMVFNNDTLIDSISQLFHAEIYADIDHIQMKDRFYLSQNYPNPFNPTTLISYTLPKRNHVSISIYDISGRLIDTLVNDIKNSGNHKVNWTALNIPSGVYFYKITTDDFIDVKKCLLIK